MTSWRHNLRPALFRGVPFKVQDAGGSGGRRLSVKKIAHRDKSKIEDMGLDDRAYSISAFILGDDYMQKRDELLDALEQKGPGSLVHPYHGTLRVVVDQRFSWRETIRDGGMVTFDISFLKCEDNTLPIEKDDTAAGLLSKSAIVMDKLSDSLKKNYSLKSLPDWAQRLATDDLENVVSEARSVIEKASSASVWGGEFDKAIEGVISSSTNVDALAGGLKAALKQPMGGISSLTDIAAWAVPKAKGLASAAVTELADRVGTQMKTNQLVVREFVRGNFLAQAASSLVDADVTVFQDAMEMRKQITQAIDTEMEGTKSDDVYQAWADLRVDVHKNLTERSKNAARLLPYTPTDVLPSLVVAYDLYEDAGREDEIMKRNKIVQSSFLPVTELKVLSV